MKKYCCILFIIIIFCFSCKEKQKKNVVSKGIKTIKLHKDTIQKVIIKRDLYLEKFKNTVLDSLYEISNKIQPNYLKADFDGDGKEDIVYLIKEKQSGKIGLVFLHQDNLVSVIAAGKEFNSQWDEMNWLDVFELDTNKVQYEMLIDNKTSDIIGDKEVIIPNIGIRIRENEGSGGLLYFEKGEYRYLHQGD